MNFISKFRKEKGMNQKQFSEKTGLSISKISKAENHSLNLEDACAICIAFPNELHIKNLSIQRISASANE